MSFAKPTKQEADAGPSLLCSAHGCPIKWSVKIESPLCSYHAWEDPKLWHAITDDIRANGAPALPMSSGSRTVEEMKSRMRVGHRFTSLEKKAA